MLVMILKIARLKNSTDLYHMAQKIIPSPSSSSRRIWTLTGLLLLGISYGCQNDLEEVARVITPEELHMEFIENFEMWYSDSAVVRVRISGPQMIRHLDEVDPRQEFPAGVHVEFFGSPNTVTSQLHSKYAIRYEKEDRIIVRDSVVWRTINQEVLETEELIWDEKNEKVYTNKFVTLRRPDEIIYGHGFESNQDFSRSKVRAIEGRIKLDKMGN